MKSKINLANYKDNCFDLIRYYAAFAIMLLHFTGYYFIETHEYSSMEYKMAQILRKIPTSAPPVIIFFCLSGFLGMASLSANSNIKVFIKKRVLRLYPSLWICTLINIISIFIICGKNINVRQFLIWIVTQVFGFANTPDFFKSKASGSINGTLWTILVQMQLYLIIVFLYKFRERIKLYGWISILSLCAAANILCRLISDKLSGNGIICKLIERSFIPYLVFVITGVIIYLYFDCFIKYVRKFWPLALLIIIIISSGLLPDYGYYAGVVTILMTSFLFMSLGYCITLRLGYDISYELFLYHWIVLNLVIHFDLFNKFPMFICLCIFTLGSIFLAVIGHRLNDMIIKKISL